MSRIDTPAGGGSGDASSISNVDLLQLQQAVFLSSHMVTATKLKLDFDNNGAQMNQKEKI